MVSLENPNEYDISKGSGERDWVGRIRGFCAALRTAAKADAGTRALPIVGPSFTSEGAYKQVGDLSSCVDATNAHPYGGAREPETRGWGDNGYGSLDWTLRQLAIQSPSKPAQFTEAGYHNAVGSTTGHIGTPEEVDAKYTARMYLRNYAAGVQRTYKYELVDEGPAPTNDPEAAFGLLRQDLSEKPSYRVVSNLIALLSDKGCAEAPGSLDYGLGGDTADVRQLLLQKCDGSSYLILWQGRPSYDVDAGKSYAVADRTVTLTLGSAADVATARPLTSATLTPVGTAARSVGLSVPDHPLVVRIGRAAPAPVTTAPTASVSPSSGPPAPGRSWVTNGAARREGSAITLTPARRDQAGSAMLPELVATKSLRVRFDAEISGGTGGDGMTLAMLGPEHPAAAIGGTGGNLGLHDLPGFAVVLDTYRNAGDPARNFVGLVRGGRGERKLLAASTDIPDLRSGRHRVEVSVTGGRVSVLLDGVRVLDAAAALPAEVRLGFTASTGGLTDRHLVSGVTVSE